MTEDSNQKIAVLEKLHNAVGIGLLLSLENELEEAWYPTYRVKLISNSHACILNRRGEIITGDDLRIFLDAVSSFYTLMSEEDVQILNTKSPKAQVATTPVGNTSKARQEGYIYIIRAVTPQNHYKIGLSKEPVTRIETMGVKLPFPIEALHLIPTNDMFSAERLLHSRYDEKRVNGEWFALSDDDVAEICQIDQLHIEGVQS